MSIRGLDGGAATRHGRVSALTCRMQVWIIMVCRLHMHVWVKGSGVGTLELSTTEKSTFLCIWHGPFVAL